MFLTVSMHWIACQKTVFHAVAPDTCPNFYTATARFDGETLWWGSDTTNTLFEGSFVQRPNEQTFIFTTNQQVCMDFFEITQSAFGAQCPIGSYTWHWEQTAPQQYELHLQVPESTLQCAQQAGQDASLFWFVFRIRYF